MQKLSSRCFIIKVSRRKASNFAENFVYFDKELSRYEQLV
jgi:hypothetical protein